MRRINGRANKINVYVRINIHVLLKTLQWNVNDNEWYDLGRWTCMWGSCICCIAIIAVTLNGHYGFRWVGSKRTINGHSPQNINKCSQPHAQFCATLATKSLLHQRVFYKNNNSKQKGNRNKNKYNHITEKRLLRCSYSSGNLCEILYSLCIETKNREPWN